MSSLRLLAAGDGPLKLEKLPLRMPRAAGVIDPEPFRARARGEGPALSEAYFPSRGMRTIHLTDGHAAALFDIDGPVLTFVLTGQLAILPHDGGATFLEPGGVLLSEGGRAEAVVRASGECRLLQVFLDAEFPGPKACALDDIPAQSRVAKDHHCLRMVKHHDERSYFHRFPEMFCAPGAWSAITPIVGLRFIEMAVGTFIDWHPEIVNNLVVVMGGGLELEVGAGACRTQVFWPGDVCLAQDSTGQGHIDRVRGTVRVAVMIIEDQFLWPLSAQLIDDDFL